MTACVEIIRFVKTCILSEDREAARQLHSLIITLSWSRMSLIQWRVPDCLTPIY